jgi:hypothetical protein
MESSLDKLPSYRGTFDRDRIFVVIERLPPYLSENHFFCGSNCFWEVPCCILGKREKAVQTITTREWTLL